MRIIVLNRKVAQNRENVPTPLRDNSETKGIIIPAKRALGIAMFFKPLLYRYIHFQGHVLFISVGTSPIGICHTDLFLIAGYTTESNYFLSCFLEWRCSFYYYY